MKRILLFLTGIAAMLMAACSQDEPAPNGNDPGNDKLQTSYMAVNLISSDDAGSRAETYEVGTAAENKITKVRFYFFNAAGGSVNVKLQDNKYVNFYDWSPTEGEQGTDTNDKDDIEKTMPIQIVINTKEGDKLPSQMVAVLNPTLPAVTYSLTELKDYGKDYATTGLTTEGSFVMSNSVYLENGSEICAVPIKSKNYAKTKEDAKNNPVTIYVERIVAKVKVNTSALSFTEGTKRIALKRKNGTNEEDFKVEGQQVYLELKGWSLTAETDKSKLVKKINPEWSFKDNWNWNSAHRSCWAINDQTAENVYFSYSNIENKFPVSKYTNENAQLNDVNNTGKAQNHTKVILKGTICKEDGTPLTIVRHMGAHFFDTYSETGSENLPKLKENILSMLAASGANYYFEAEEEGKTVRKQIDTSDLMITPATTITAEDSKNNCFVYAQLTEDAKGKTWYNTLDKEAQPLENAATLINNDLKDKKKIDWALVWRDGMTYYYYEIIHHNAQEQSNRLEGVVRNHVYDTRVTKILGLGTPVYDPTKVIYPEKPDPNEHYIAAQINILSWHVVTDNYELEW